VPGIRDPLAFRRAFLEAQEAALRDPLHAREPS
jgi:hypothetical protein